MFDEEFSFFSPYKNYRSQVIADSFHSFHSDRTFLLVDYNRALLFFLPRPRPLTERLRMSEYS